MRGRLLKLGGCLLAVGMVASCLLFLPPMLGISGAGEMDIRQASSDAARGEKGMLLLAKPAFAQEGQQAGITFVEEEAGISAWTKVEGGIDVDKAATAFKILEYQTDEYVIGSVGLPDLPETEDVRVFVHKDGWMLAYYFKGDPIAKIIDWKNLAATKLEQALGMVSTAAAVPFVAAKHYDFRYPDAEKLMVIIDGDTFRLKIPGNFTVYQRSYSLHDRQQYDYAKLVINESEVASGPYGFGVIYGTLTPAQLKPDVFDTIRVIHAGSIAIVLAYEEG